MGTFEWAQKYLALNWSIIPILAHSKEPLIPWKEFQTRRANEAELKEWLKKWPDMNLGIVTGEISGLVVVDLDGIDGIKYGQSHKLITSIVSKTGNGKQVFYKWLKDAGNVKNSVSKLASGVDIRGDGGFVVVPPSVHPSGRMYRWERFVPNVVGNLPTCITESVSTVPTQNIAKPDGWIATALEEMKIGNIDDTLTSVLGRLRRDNYSEQDARSLLSPWATKAGATEGHLEEKIRNIWSRYEPKTNTDSVYGSNGGLHIHTPADDDSFNKFSESLCKRDSGGIQTGFPTLDRFCEGGLKSERLFTVAARTGVGKTFLAINLARQLCEQSKKVLLFSTEFQYQKIWQRYVNTMRDASQFREHLFFVCDSFTPRIDQVEAAIKEIMPDVWIFDHVNQIGEEKEVLSQFMLGCNFLQRKYVNQGIMVAQLNRQADWVTPDGKRVEPRLSMIKGSDTIGQSSSRVLLLSEVKVTPEGVEIVAILDKNDSGNRGTFSLLLQAHTGIMKEL